MQRVERFDYKLAGMRKSDNFIVYPDKIDGKWIVAQGNRSIVAVDPETCRGIVNWRGSNGKYFLHLKRELGAEAIYLPKEFVGLCVEFRPSSGDLIGSSPMTGPVYVA